MCKLEEEPAMHNSKTYFKSTYVYRKTFWTACYRRQAILITNIVLKAFHKSLKHVYLKRIKINVLMFHCVFTLSSERNTTIIIVLYDICDLLLLFTYLFIYLNFYTIQ